MGRRRRPASTAPALKASTRKSSNSRAGIGRTPEARLGGIFQDRRRERSEPRMRQPHVAPHGAHRLPAAARWSGAMPLQACAAEEGGQHNARRRTAALAPAAGQWRWPLPAGFTSTREGGGSPYPSVIVRFFSFTSSRTAARPSPLCSRRRCACAPRVHPVFAACAHPLRPVPAAALLLRGGRWPAASAYAAGAALVAHDVAATRRR